MERREIAESQIPTEYQPTQYERTTWRLECSRPANRGVLSRQARSAFERAEAVNLADLISPKQELKRTNNEPEISRPNRQLATLIFSKVTELLKAH